MADNNVKRQSFARALIYQLAERLRLDKSLGAEFQNIQLPEKLDLSKIIDHDIGEGSATASSSSAVNNQAGMASSIIEKMSGGEPSRQNQSAPSQQQANNARRLSQSARSAPISELGVSAGVNLPPFSDSPLVENKEAAMEEVCTPALSCTKCPLAESRRNVVFGEGSLNSEIVFVGEAPGRDEDIQGRPFVGRAGVLFTAMVEKGMQIPRSEIYICNILKCRPPSNRDPNPNEIVSCVPYLHQQLNIIRPKIIISMGRIASQILTGKRMSMKRLRGNLMDYRGIPLMPIYHPAYLIRARQREGGKTMEDKLTWQDLQAVMKFLKNER